jgi:hypothetical protein
VLFWTRDAVLELLPKPVLKPGLLAFLEMVSETDIA